MELDKTGLNDRAFEAFARTSDREYFYPCNMQTDVSRWSRNAVERFGLPGEYLHAAGAVWEQHIHPDDRPSTWPTSRPCSRAASCAMTSCTVPATVTATTSPAAAAEWC